MKFITDQEDRHSRIQGHDIYTVVEIPAETHEAAIAAFIARTVRAVDLDVTQEEVFQIRFEDGTCYAVSYTAWAAFKPEWHIEETLEVQEIPLSACRIAEAPGAFITKRRPAGEHWNAGVPQDGIVIGAFLLSPPTPRGKGKKGSYRNSTGCLPLRETATGDPALRLHVATFNTTLTIPLSVLKDNGCDIEVLVKFPNPDSPDDTPAP